MQGALFLYPKLTAGYQARRTRELGRFRLQSPAYFSLSCVWYPSEEQGLASMVDINTGLQGSEPRGTWKELLAAQALGVDF